MNGTYVVRFGPYLKIGSSSDVVQRLRNIPHEEIIGFIPNSRAEAWMHSAFAHLKIDLANGMREWFRDDPTIRKMVESVSVPAEWSGTQNAPTDMPPAPSPPTESELQYLRERHALENSIIALPSGAYQVRAAEVRADSKFRLLFLDLQVTAGPMRGKTVTVP